MCIDRTKYITSKVQNLQQSEIITSFNKQFENINYRYVGTKIKYGNNIHYARLKNKYKNACC